MDFITVPPVVGHGKGCTLSHFVCLDFKSPISKSRGINLPHWEQVDKLQFVTLRLIDSLPQSELERLSSQIPDLKNGSFLLADKTPEQYLSEIEYWLNRGFGNCILSLQPVQQIVEQALKFYDGLRWDLYDYVIMPNHIHFLAVPFQPMEEIMGMFIRYTTKRINAVLGTEGKVWQHDYFDRIIRSLADYSEKAQYIRQNPTASQT